MNCSPFTALGLFLLSLLSLSLNSELIHLKCPLQPVEGMCCHVPANSIPSFSRAKWTKTKCVFQAIFSRPFSTFAYAKVLVIKRFKHLKPCNACPCWNEIELTLWLFEFVSFLCGNESANASSESTAWWQILRWWFCNLAGSHVSPITTIGRHF